MDGDEVAIVHVGDSRAYLFRDGELRQLTRDHSLVEELRRQGRLTPEEAEEHPQRSIITRALGPERDVELDVHTHRARSGDLYLLCSDGLTSMVREDRLREILDRERFAAGRRRRAGRGGQRDGGPRQHHRGAVSGSAVTATDADRDGPAVDETVVGLRAPEPEADTGEQDAVPVPAARRNRLSLLLAPRRTAGAPRRTLQASLLTLVVLAVLAGAVVGAVARIRSVYFVGQDDRGLVTLYRGVPYELPLGVDLYEPQYVSSVPARTLSPTQRRRLLDHQLRSREDAADIVRELERGRQ